MSIAHQQFETAYTGAPVAPPVVPLRTERRRHARTRTYMVATVNYGNLLLPCFVLDLSTGGAKVKMFENHPLPDGPCELECGRFGKVPAEIAWNRGQFAGIRFRDGHAPQQSN